MNNLRKSTKGILCQAQNLCPDYLLPKPEFISIVLHYFELDQNFILSKAPLIEVKLFFYV